MQKVSQARIEPKNIKKFIRILEPGSHSGSSDREVGFKAMKSYLGTDFGKRFCPCHFVIPTVEVKRLCANN
jgi:hypothetical protein